MRLLEVRKRNLPTSLRAEMHTRARIGLFLRRLHCVQGQPVALASTHLPPEGVDLTPAQLGARSSYVVIETLLGWRIQRARLSIRLEQVSKAAAKHLEMKSTASVMILERTSYVTGDRACEHTLFEIRPERFEFVLDSEGGPRPPAMRATHRLA